MNWCLGRVTGLHNHYIATADAYAHIANAIEPHVIVFREADAVDGIVKI